MTTYAMPKCLTCKHFQEYGELTGTCSAFTEIPRDIFYNIEPHTTVLPNQKGNDVYKKSANNSKSK